VLTRFYRLFESIYSYIADFNKYLQELGEGFYIQHTVEGVLLDMSGRQLVCEGLYLIGVMLLMLDMKVSGPVRERMLVAQYRHKGEGSVPLSELAKLCRDSGYRHDVPSAKRPANYPEEYLARFTIPPKIVAMIIGRLRSDDVYNSARVYPAPEQRPVALAQQASMLYVALYFSPKTLHEAKPVMREIVDKHFSDSWVLPLYMGSLVDLSVEWERYRAAKEALAMDTLVPARVKDIMRSHATSIAEVHRALDGFLTEGVLTESFVVDSLTPLLDTVRTANIALRWILLHRCTETKKWRDMVVAAFGDKKPVLDFLLRTSLLEYRLKVHIKHLLAVKATKWAENRAATAAILTELSEYFSGSRALTRVDKDEGLLAWFATLAKEVSSLDYADGVLAGRKIRQLIKALDDVTAFDVIDTSANVKEFLGLAKTNLTDMVRTVNITDQTLADLNTLSDFSYAWVVMHDFVPDMHDRIRGDPTAVRLLRAAFLKLTSVLDVPLVRITEARSQDALSVAEYYSGELVDFLRTVMEVIPIIIFSILRDVITLQAKGMAAVPVRIELAQLRDYSQLEQRAVLAKRTHEIGIFTEGILAMEKTLLGVIQVDPRQILKDGISKHLVDQISRALHTCLCFDLRGGRGRDPKANVEGALLQLRDTLDAYRRAFEYVQDYISLYGLKMWQEAFTRIVGFNTEQECNRFTRRKILPEASAFQNKAIPLPLFLRPPPGDASPPGNLTFMGRLVDSLVGLTHFTRTVYGPGASGGAWYDPTGREVAGVGLFVLLNSAVGVPGLTGCDRLFGFSVERDLTRLLRGYAGELKAGAGDLLTRLADELQPLTAVSPNVVRMLVTLSKKLAKPLDSVADLLMGIGHAQLLRRALAHELRFSARLDSNLLAGAVDALNVALLTDIRRHFSEPESHPIPDGDNPLLAQAAAYCEAMGINDPLTNIYITVEPALQPPMGVWLTLFVIAQAPRLAYDREFGSLVRRRPGDAIDGGPLVAGLATLLKQMHPSVTDDFFAHVGQYIRSVVHGTVGAAVGAAPAGSKGERDLAKAPPSLPPDVYTCLLIVQQLARAAHVPERVVHVHVPAYLFDTLTE
jgi:WASH complex subunit strumpellin